MRSEIPYAIRRAQKALPPAMDAAGLARHLSVAELQVRRGACTAHAIIYNCNHPGDRYSSSA